MLTIIQTTCGVFWPCSFPLGWLFFQIGYMISLIALFTNFYIQVNLTLRWPLTFVLSLSGAVWSTAGALLGTLLGAGTVL